MTKIAVGLTYAGFVPALNTSSLFPPKCRKTPSAIGERQEFPVHKIKTSGLSRLDEMRGAAEERSEAYWFVR